MQHLMLLEERNLIRKDEHIMTELLLHIFKRRFPEEYKISETQEEELSSEALEELSNNEGDEE